MSTARFPRAGAELERLRDAWRRGGAAGTPAQDKARRANAKRAGRPGRVCCYCGEPVVGGHVDRALDTSCGAHGWQWAQPSSTPRPPVTPDPELLGDVLAFLTNDPAQYFVAGKARAARLGAELTAKRRARLVKRIRAVLAACAPAPAELAP